MTPTINLDTRQFEAAIKEYLLATQKDGAYVVNRQALNVVIKTAQITPMADKAAIRALPQTKEWWPKLVAKRLTSGHGIRTTLRGEKVTLRGRLRRWGRRNSFTRAQARQASKAIIRNRLRSVGFIKSGWLPAMRIFQALKLKSKSAMSAFRGATHIKNPKGTAIVATPGLNPTATIANNNKGAGKVGAAALQQGLNLAAVDMREFIRDRYSETARARGVGK